MARRKRRSRTQHVGVKIRTRTLPNGDRRWRAHWRDPHTGKEQAFTLDPRLHAAREAREAWARAKAESLARERADLAAGRARPTKTPLDVAVAAYFAAAARLRPRTITDYQRALAPFVAWCASAGITVVERLRPALLSAYRDARAAVPRRAPARGAGVGRGARKDTRRPRAAHTLNHELRVARVVLNHWRARGLLPLLDRDAIRDHLAGERAPAPRPRPLTRGEPAALLQAALRHDADVFQATRAEHAGDGTPGATPRHDPIAPLLAFLLLSGCRLGEALALRWANVDLDALGEDGAPAGEVTFTETKTHRDRAVPLDIAPTLRALLVALKLRAGTAGYVFGGARPLPMHRVQAARRRLLRDFGAPDFCPQRLRQSCGCYLVNSNIYGTAGPYRAAKRLGHGLAVSEKHYLDVVRGIPREALTLEAAMGVEAEMRELLARTGAPGAVRDASPVGTAARAGD